MLLLACNTDQINDKKILPINSAKSSMCWLVIPVLALQCHHTNLSSVMLLSACLLASMQNLLASSYSIVRLEYHYADSFTDGHLCQQTQRTFTWCLVALVSALKNGMNSLSSSSNWGWLVFTWMYLVAKADGLLQCSCSIPWIKYTIF